MPDGTTLFTEPGASRVHKIDKSGAISVFVENTERANGLALDSKGRLIATTADSIVVLHPTQRGAGKDAHASERPRRRQEGRRLFHAAERQTVGGVLHTDRAARRPSLAKPPGAHGIQLSPDEKTLYSADSGGEYLIAFDVQPDGKLTNTPQLRQVPGVAEPREPCRRHRRRQPGPRLRRHRDRCPGVQPEGRGARSDSDVAAPAEPRVCRPGQEDAVSHRRQRDVLGQDAGAGICSGRPK